MRTAGWPSWTSACSSAWKPRTWSSSWPASARRPRATGRSSPAAGPVGFLPEPERVDPEELYEYVLDSICGTRRTRRSRSPRRSPREVMIEASDPRSSHFRHMRHQDMRPEHLFGRRMEMLTLAVLGQLRAATTGTGSRASGCTRTSRSPSWAAPRRRSTRAPWREPPAQARRADPRAGGDRPGRAGDGVAFARERARRRRRDRGRAPVLFILLAASLSCAFFPYQLLAAASGPLFGTAAGTPVTIAALMLAGDHPVLDRSLRRAHRGRRAVRARAFGTWQDRIERGGFLAVLYARIVPLSPFVVINYVSGLTRLRLSTFALATLISVIRARICLHGARRPHRQPRLARGAGRVRRARRDGTGGRIPRLERRRPAPPGRSGAPCGGGARRSGRGPAVRTRRARRAGSGTGSSSPARRSAGRR